MVFHNNTKMSVRTRKVNTGLGKISRKSHTHSTTHREEIDNTEIQIKEEKIEFDSECNIQNTKSIDAETVSAHAEHETNEKIKTEIKTETADADFQFESPDIESVSTDDVLTYYFKEPDNDFRRHFESEIDDTTSETEMCNTDSTFAAGILTSTETAVGEAAKEKYVNPTADFDSAKNDSSPSTAPTESTNQLKRNAARKRKKTKVKNGKELKRTSKSRDRTAPKTTKHKSGDAQIDDFDAKKIALNLLSTGSLYSCPICAQKFTRRYNLMAHMQIHFSERPQFRSNTDDQFPCSLCGKKFSANDDLQLHYNTHLYKLQSRISEMQQDAEFEMDDTAAYDNSRELDSLLEVTPKIITKEPENSAPNNSSPAKINVNSPAAVSVYSCLICEKTFRRRNNLTSHMQIHSSEKQMQCPKENQFPCSMCGKRFSTRQALQLHVKNHGSYVQFVMDAVQQGIV